MTPCPRCDGLLQDQYLATVKVARCSLCEGCWFRRGGLAELAQVPAQTLRYLLPELKRHPAIEYPRKDDEAECPDCSSALKSTRTGSQGGSRVDVCRKCRGAWIDLPELRRLIEHVVGANPVAQVWNMLKAALLGPNGITSR